MHPESTAASVVGKGEGHTPARQITNVKYAQHSSSQQGTIRGRRRATARNWNEYVCVDSKFDTSQTHEFDGLRDKVE